MSKRVMTHAILGDNVSGSFSPDIHNAVFEDLGLDNFYGRLEQDESFKDPAIMAAFLTMQAATGLKGASVTTPFKETMMQIPDVVTDVDEITQQIGAINTLTINDDGITWSGTNTDWIGATQALKDRKVTMEDANVLMIGAGGAARAVSFGLAKEGARKITVLNRSFSNADKLTKDIAKHYKDTEFVAEAFDYEDLLGANTKLLDEADIVFNATPVGQTGKGAEQGVALPGVYRLKHGASVFDSVFSPDETPLIKKANEHGGLVVVHGIEMLLRQAVGQAKLFTGRDDVRFEVMSKALYVALARVR